MKILFYGESPVVATGLAQVTRTIVDALYGDSHQIRIVGMNHHGVESYDKNIYPYDIATLIDKEDANAFSTIKAEVEKDDFDCLFVSTDFGRDHPVYLAMSDEQRKNKLIIGYYAIDCDILNAQTFDSLTYCNVKMTYTHHGKRIIESYRPDMKDLISVIPLACEPDVFYPLSPEERRKARKEIFYTDDDDKFIVINVNRNQPRKDLGRTLMIFHEFHKDHPNSLIYMHCQQNDSGGHLPSMAVMLGMDLGKEILFSDEKFHVLRGFTREYLNRIYNAADCLFSSSLGEGWGLSTTEAMAAGTPVCVPANTAFTEIVGEYEERGYLMKSGGDIDHQQWLYKMTNHPHDILRSDHAIEKLNEIYYDREGARRKALRARAWCEKNTKNIIGDRWKQLFRDVNNINAEKDKKK